MDQLSAIRSFIEIADKGSLTRAAETLDLSRAMISRHLAGLEQWLGARLLHRTTRRVSLSEAGLEALPRLRQMLELASDLQAVAGAHRTEPTGRLRITTSLSFAVSCLTQADHFGLHVDSPDLAAGHHRRRQHRRKIAWFIAVPTRFRCGA